MFEGIALKLAWIKMREVLRKLARPRMEMDIPEIELFCLSELQIKSHVWVALLPCEQKEGNTAYCFIVHEKFSYSILSYVCK